MQGRVPPSSPPAGFTTAAQVKAVVEQKTLITDFVGAGV